MDDARESSGTHPGSETHRAEHVENEDVHDVLADDQDGTVPDEDRPLGDDPQELLGDDPASGGS